MEKMINDFYGTTDLNTEKINIKLNELANQLEKEKEENIDKLNNQNTILENNNKLIKEIEELKNELLNDKQKIKN